MDNKQYIGWDIGGAHLKLACIDSKGDVNDINQYPTPLWQSLDTLDDAIIKFKASLKHEKYFHALTMTGELVDLFRDRNQGVNKILDRVTGHFPGDVSLVYAGDKGLVPVDIINENNYLDVASSNWHATASFVADNIEHGFLVDVGSTTTDIIPFMDGHLCHRGSTDQERLRFGELVYTGIARTPVMSVVDRVPFNGDWQSVAAENFATMADIFRILGLLDESCDMYPPADDTGKSIHDSMRRLARMVGADFSEQDNHDKWRELAVYISTQQFQKINMALSQVKSMFPGLRETNIIGAGSGRFLTEKLSSSHGMNYFSFADLLQTKYSPFSKLVDCATAVSVAQLARHHEYS